MNNNQDKTMWVGVWTEQKLNAFAKYVHAYLTIMNKNGRLLKGEKYDMMPISL